MLKPIDINPFDCVISAAFGRLCVETSFCWQVFSKFLTAAFGRLCVETRHKAMRSEVSLQPPSGGCVLKPAKGTHVMSTLFSRLRAAVC